MGLGVMGAGMAGSLLRKGFPVAVYNRSPQRAQALVEKGARLASSPKDAASTADFIVSIVADDAASKAVWLGDHGALAGAKPGSVLVESSTLSPVWVRELAALAEKQKCEFLDAPVTGTKVHAEGGELYFLVGGDAATLEKFRPVIDATGRGFIHLGPTGSGATMKLVNNLLCGVQAASLGECLALAEREGLDVEKATTVLLNGAPGSPLVKAIAARMMRQNYSVNFSLKLMEKDLSYSLDEAGRKSASLKTVAAARDLFRDAIAKGYGEKDFSAVIEPLRGKRQA